MLRAAVRDRIGNDFSECPPGHRFNLYFRIWTDRWNKEETSTAALRDVLGMQADARALLDALIERQQRLAQAIPAEHLCMIDAQTTSPFATGLGLEHPIENGFSFLTPYGLPYLAGSGVKGVLRRAAEELRDEGEPSIDNALIDALFGPENTEEAQRGALTCWDVLPQFDALTLEIMTPHQSGYYLGNETPHDAGKPTPITFLALPAGAKFRFVLCFEPSLVPEPCRAALADWQALVIRIARHAFDWLGFGAKTAVGYGAMEEDPAVRAVAAARQKEALRVQAEEQERQALQDRLDRASPAARAMIEFLAQPANKNRPELNALVDGLGKGRFGEHAAEVAGAVKQCLQTEGRWKETSTKKNPEKDRDFQDTLKVKQHLDKQ